MLAKVCFDASFMCLFRFVEFLANFNDLCCWTQRCGLLSRIHLKSNGPILADWSNSICFTFWSCLYSLLTSNWEVSTSRLPYNFSNFPQITHFFCRLMALKQIFQLQSIPCLHLHDILKRLLAKVCFDASFMCLSRFAAFRVTFND